MDPVTEQNSAQETFAQSFALSKENIQPLRYGRNPIQLDTALRAREDVGAQHLLQQERQTYEEAIKNYTGDDPLENWYEYILWAEQSYPNNGHDSPLAKLLYDCLNNFEKEPKYKQDRRFIRLWINFISTQKNPVELYQLLYNNGIGTMIADLYCAWAFELEQMQDFKKADEVYLIGLQCRAEPREELEFAHKNFQLSLGRKMLGKNEQDEVSVTEQRQAFSSLRAIRAGKKVGSVRTGHRVRDYMPGPVPQQMNSTNHVPKSNGPIQIYEDEIQREMKGSSILDHVPIENTMHKENTIKPGPWSNVSKKRPLMPPTTRPSFKIHEDSEEIDMEKVRLFPNHVQFFDDSKYDEQYVVPVFVPDVPNPNVMLKPHYPKDLVYANNIDLSLEQIKAQKYFQSRCQNNLSSNGQAQEANSIDQHSLMKSNSVSIYHDEPSDELEKKNLERQRILEQQKETELERQRQLEQQLQEAELERQRQLEQQQQEVELERQRQLEQQQREADLERQRQLEQQQREAELERLRQLEQQQREAELERQRQIGQQREAELEHQRQQELERQRQEELKRQAIYEAEQNELKRLETEHLQQQQSLHSSSSYLSQHHSSTTDEQHLLGQSMTVNTKEAMSAVQDLWQSPTSSNTSRVMSSPMMHQGISSANKMTFDIHMDSSMTQNVMVNSKIHQQQQHHQSYGPVPIYNDQENQFHNSYPNNEQRNSYGNRSALQNSYHYPLTPQHEQHMQSSQQQPLQHQPPQHTQQHLQPPHHQAIMHPQQQHHHRHQQMSPHMTPPSHQHSHHQISPHSMHQNVVTTQQHYVHPQHMQHMQPHLQQHMMAQQHQQQHPSVSHINTSAQINTSQRLNSSQHMSIPMHMNVSIPHNVSQHLNTSQQHMNISQQHISQQHMNISQQHINTSQHMNASHVSSSQHINTSQMSGSQRINTSQQHIQPHPHHHQVQQHPQHPHIQQTQQHIQQSQHVSHQSHQPQMYSHVPNNMGYEQPYATANPSGHTSLEHSQKQQNSQGHYSGFIDPTTDANNSKSSSYRMPSELPLIKSPGMNRRDLKYLENAENKENNSVAVGLDFNGAVETDAIKQMQPPQPHTHQQPPDQNNPYVDESLGISPLPGVNETCFTETFNQHQPLFASTPMTSQFKMHKHSKDFNSPQPQHSQHLLQHQEQQENLRRHQYQQQQQQHDQENLQRQHYQQQFHQHQQQQQHQHQQMQHHQQQYHQQYMNQAVSLPQPVHSIPNVTDVNDKLSVIMESTKEYASTSSASSGTNRTVLTMNRDDLTTIKEQSIHDMSNLSNVYDQSQHAYEQKMRAQIQAVHAQSPRTVQRNVDQITTEIKTNCDLRKSINFNGRSDLSPNQTLSVPPLPELEGTVEKSDASMECEYQEPMEQVEEEPEAEIKEEPPFELPKGDINPFDKSLISGLLRNMKFPQEHHSEGYHKLKSNLTKFVPSSIITLANDQYDLDKCLGKGTYGTVFKGTELATRRIVALKTQKPAWVWEYYISREIRTRLKNPHMLRGFMDVQSAYIAENGSVLVSEFSKYGTLLEVTNKIKISTGKPLCEPLAIFFTIEMMQIVEYLHKCQIIHADIKPDNFLLMHMPSEDTRPTIQLIDFGCSIDMSLFPEDTKFTQIIKTEDFTCIEMQTGKPWTYQTDLYCLAASSHCLLFGTYMRVSMSGKKWYINSKLPRYAKKVVWEKYFTELLNIESCENLPDLVKLRNMMEEALGQISELQNKYRQFKNVLNHR